MIVSFELPDSFASVDPRHLKEALVVMLYPTGKLGTGAPLGAMALFLTKLKNRRKVGTSRE